LDEEQGDIKNS